MFKSSFLHFFLSNNLGGKMAENLEYFQFDA